MASMYADPVLTFGTIIVDFAIVLPYLHSLRKEDPTGTAPVVPLKGPGASRYFTLLGILALLSHLPGVVFYGLILFFFPGLLLIISNTILLYSILLLPFFLPWRSARNRTFMRTVSLALTALVAIAPSLISRYCFETVATEQGRDDMDRWSPRPIRSIALTSWNAPGCDETCQRLLYGGEVEKVVEYNRKTLPDTYPPRVPHFIAYTIEHRRNCDTQSATIPAVRARIVAGECLVARTGEGYEPVDVAVREAEDDWSDGLFLRRTRTRSITVTLGDGPGAETVLRTTEFSSHVMTLPFFVWGDEYGQISVTPIIARRKRRHNPIEYNAVLTQRLGFKLAPVTENLDKTAVVRGLLASPRSERPFFGDAEIAFLEDYTREMDKRPLSDDDLALVRTMIRDRRIDRSVFVFSNIIYHHKRELAPLLPDMLDRIAVSDGLLERGTVETLSGCVAAMPDEMLAPYANRLRQVVQDAARAPVPEYVVGRDGKPHPSDQYTREKTKITAVEPLILRLGAVSPDAAQLLESLLSNPQRKVVTVAAEGLCVAGRTNAEQTAPALRMAFARFHQDHFPTDAEKAAALALVRLGHKDEALALVEKHAPDPDDFGKLWTLDANFPTEECTELFLARHGPKHAAARSGRQ